MYRINMYSLTYNDVSQLKGYFERKTSQAQKIDGTKVIRASKNMVHNTRYGVQQLQRGSGLATDAVLTAGFLSANPAVAALGVQAVEVDLALDGVDFTLEQVEWGLNTAFPNVKRSQQKVSFEKEDLRARPEKIPQKFVNGFVEGDLSSNRIQSLETAEQARDKFEKIPVVGDVHRTTRTTREKAKAEAREKLNQMVQPIKDASQMLS